MTMNKEDSNLNLPETLPIFPLEGVLLLPGAELPLNIFEKRYIEMVDRALCTDRLIGIIQPDKRKEKTLYKIGCAGKIISFTEMDDGRYLLTLKGLSRFHIRKEEKEESCLFRLFRVDWSLFSQDLRIRNTIIENKEQFIPLLKTYFKKQGLSCDWHILEKTKDEKLVALLSMICPFQPEEKQMLLEANDGCERAKKLKTLLHMDVVFDHKEDNGHSKH